MALRQKKSSAGKYAMGVGLMALGQNFQQQIADSAAQRRQDSLLALQREWQLEDRAERREREDFLMQQQRQESDRQLALQRGFARMDLQEQREYDAPFRDLQIRAMERELEKPWSNPHLDNYYDALAEQARARGGTAINEFEFVQGLQKTAQQSMAEFNEQAQLLGRDMAGVRELAGRWGFEPPQGKDPARAMSQLTQQFQARTQEQMREGVERFQQYQASGNIMDLLAPVPEGPVGGGGGEIVSEGESSGLMGAGVGQAIGAGARGMLLPFGERGAWTGLARQTGEALGPLAQGISAGWRGQGEDPAIQEAIGIAAQQLEQGQGEGELYRMLIDEGFSQSEADRILQEAKKLR